MRLIQHNTGFFKNSYTSKASDWELFYQMRFESRSEARKLESFIKRQKSRKFIEDLKKDPDLGRRIMKR